MLVRLPGFRHCSDLLPEHKGPSWCRSPGFEVWQTQHSLKYVCSSTAQGKPVHLLVSSSIKWGYPIVYTPATVHIGKQTHRSEVIADFKDIIKE